MHRLSTPPIRQGGTSTVSVRVPVDQTGAQYYCPKHLFYAQRHWYLRSKLVPRHRQRCSKRASHCGQIYTARRAPLIRSACSIDLALCVRARGLVSQFAGGCGDASGKRVCAPNPHRGQPQPTSTPAVGGGRRATASSGVSGARVVAAQRGGGGTPPQGVPGHAGAAGALHGPRRHLRGSGQLRGRSRGVFRRPQEPHCAVTIPY
jgi:hypothetical protein